MLPYTPKRSFLKNPMNVLDLSASVVGHRILDIAEGQAVEEVHHGNRGSMSGRDSLKSHT